MAVPKKPTPANVDAWCAEGEGQRLDFKESAQGVDTEDVVAFANAEGGIILIGVSELPEVDGVRHGKVKGLKKVTDARSRVESLCRSCSPPVRSTTFPVHHPDGKVLVAHIAKAPALTSTSSGQYVLRIGESKTPLTPPLLRAILLRQESDEFIARFRTAAAEVLDSLEALDQRLESGLESLEEQVGNSIAAAEEAQAAAEQAGATAEEMAMLRD